MTIRIELAAETLTDLGYELYKLYMSFVDAGHALPLEPSEDAATAPAGHADVAVAEAVVAKDNPAPVKRKAAAKPEPEPEPEPTKAVVDFEAVMAALKTVVVKKGFDASVKALADLNVERLKQLSADRYPEALAHFQKLVA